MQNPLPFGGMESKAKCKQNYDNNWNFRCAYGGIAAPTGISQILFNCSKWIFLKSTSWLTIKLTDSALLWQTCLFSIICNFKMKHYPLRSTDCRVCIPCFMWRPFLGKRNINHKLLLYFPSVFLKIVWHFLLCQHFNVLIHDCNLIEQATTLTVKVIVTICVRFNSNMCLDRTCAGWVSASVSDRTKARESTQQPIRYRSQAKQFMLIWLWPTRLLYYSPSNSWHIVKMTQRHEMKREKYTHIHTIVKDTGEYAAKTRHV